MLKKMPQQDRSRAVVDSILQAATRILNIDPPSEFTTNHVAAVAGVGIGSLYQYFNSKESIVRALQERHTTETLGLADTLVLAYDGRRVADRYRSLVREALALHERERCLHLNLSALGPHFVLPMCADRRQGHLKLVAELLQHEFAGLQAGSGLLYAEILLRTAQTLVHWALDLEDKRDSIVVEHYDAFVAGYYDALERMASSRKATLAPQKLIKRRRAGFHPRVPAGAA
jgi:AcrR family transcriptional regulator